MLNKLQKADKDTNDLIDQVRDYLFSIGIRTSRERAWDIFQNVHQLPYKMLIERNPTIKYQGVGNHISHKHGDQMLVIKHLGRFEIKGVSSKKDQKKTAAIKFAPSNEIKKLVQKVEVIL
jgi:hypothetical protein